MSFFPLLILLLIRGSISTPLNNINIKDAVNAYLVEGDSSIYGALSNWDISGVTDLSYLFHDDYYAFLDFNGDISQWNVSNVTNMNHMFLYAKSFNVDISNWDVSGVIDMSHMFHWSESFNSDISNWDVGNVTDMKKMFYRASIFNGNISQWNVSSVTDMSGMLCGLEFFNTDISQWNVKNVKDMTGMFDGTKSFNSDLSNWNVSNVTNMKYMFYGATYFNSDLSQWNIQNVNNMDGIFSYASSFNSEISNWNVSNVTDMHSMFKGATSFNQKLCWDLSNIKDDVFLEFPEIVLSYPQCSTESPTNSPTVYTSESIPTGPFLILSGDSNMDNEYCMIPVRGNVVQGSKIIINSCKPWKTYKWIFDEEGKIRSAEDPYLCINRKGKAISLETCVDNSLKQRWKYSSNDGRILLYQNGTRSLSVDNKVISKKLKVKFLKYSFNRNTQSYVWKLKYDSTGKVLTLPQTSNDFKIVSDLSTPNQQWCLYPTLFRIVNGSRISISTCKDWITYKFFMDKEGKIHTTSNNEFCVARQGKRLQLSPCKKGNITQLWTYSIIDKKIISLVNWKKQITLQDGESFRLNNQVLVLPEEIIGSRTQMWDLNPVKIT